MRAVICDRCQERAVSNDYPVFQSIIDDFGMRIDFCKNCYAAVIDFIYGNSNG
jgi:hypothetical protein